MKICDRCGFEYDGLNELCDNCCDELEQEMQESMSQMFDAEGNNQ
jgi:predicted amidophosphoribosyltransferase